MTLTRETEAGPVGDDDAELSQQQDQEAGLWGRQEVQQHRVIPAHVVQEMEEGREGIQGRAVGAGTPWAVSATVRHKASVSEV